MNEFQDGIDRWLAECFPPEAAKDGTERCDRFIEEALELIQACGYAPERAHALVDYVFGRPKGDQRQEVGGTMVTLAALCSTFAIDLGFEARRELARIGEPETMAKIRAKQAAKPVGSALPIAVQAASHAADTAVHLKVTANLPVRFELALFSLLMEGELQANEHKGGWQNDAPILLFATLLREAGKLEQALHTLMKDGVRNIEANRAQVIREAVDVANMAMMVADVVGGLREPKAEGPAE